MSNPIYDQMQAGRNNGGLIQNFLRFRNNFSGNAKDQVQNLLNSGKISQKQYDNAVRMANQLQKMINA